jgi:N-formylglutamate amidohydrolase
MAGALPVIDLKRLFTLTDHSLSSPVILHAPHGSRFIPDELKATFSLNALALEAEKDLMTDHFTNDLVLNTSGASSLVNGLSRFVVDVERFPDEREEMLVVGMGAFYTHGSHKQLLRESKHTTNPALRDFFDAYSDAFTELVQRTVDCHGHAVIIDVHSYPTEALPYELHSDEARPQLDIGADATHTSALLVGEVIKAFGHLQVGINESFHGTYVPLRFYEAKDSRVQSVMLEIRRDTYMDEQSVTIDLEKFSVLQESLQQLVTSLSKPTAR